MVDHRVGDEVVNNFTPTIFTSLSLIESVGISWHSSVRDELGSVFRRPNIVVVALQPVVPSTHPHNLLLLLLLH